METDANLNADSRYKIVGDVYEITEEGTLQHIPNHLVLSRLSYTHERYLITGTKEPVNFQRMFNFGVAIFLLTATTFFAAWLVIAGHLF